MHHIKQPVAHYVSGVQCRACLKLFHTRERVLNDLRYRASKCCDVVMRLRSPMTVAEVEDLDAAEREYHRKLYSAAQKRSKAMIPCLPCSGPRLHEVVLQRLAALA